MEDYEYQWIKLLELNVQTYHSFLWLLSVVLLNRESILVPVLCIT